MMEALYKKDEVRITKDDFKAMASQIQYFPGVEGWFERVDAYVKERSAGKRAWRTYIISAGQKEILEGVSIRKHFKQIYASEYHFNQYGVATFPKLLITDTSKTQFLFRINKGCEAVSESINEHMPDAVRPIPFSNLIYIGDGMTDALDGADQEKAVATRWRSTTQKLPKAGDVHAIARRRPSGLHRP